MKYRDSTAQSAAYLGPVLTLMAQQAAAMNPVSYAVWYEYVAGGNPPLKAAVDDHLRKGEVFDAKLTDEIFNTHVADIDEQAVQRFSAGLQKVLEAMSNSAAQAGDQAGQFGTALEHWCTDWSSANPGGNPEVDAILGLTRQMQGSVAALKGRLDASRNEIVELQQEVGKARVEALADGLTGLTNRRGFDAEIAACLQAPLGHAGGPTLLMADIDHFKQVNDTYGHVFGDKVIRAVAQILKQNVEGRDTAARYGGEEFVVLLPDTPTEGARLLAEKIRAMVEKVRIKRGTDDWSVANISLSLGVAAYKAGESVGEFVARADGALYASKKTGRNRVTVAAA